MNALLGRTYDFSLIANSLNITFGSQCKFWNNRTDSKENGWK